MPFNNMPSFKSILANLVDELNRFLLIILLILIIITMFIRTFILDLLKFIILGIIIFRLVSKNKYSRDKENKKYLSIKKSLLKPFNNIIRNFKDRDLYVYKRCSKCKTTLKLPLPDKRGIHYAKCPKCKRRVTLFTLRKVKVEVIKKKKDK